VAEKVNIELLARDVLALLHRHGLTPDAYGINMTIPGAAFDALAKEYPGHQPELILITKGNGIQWFVQIQRRRMPEDFPPGVILTPPPDE
jgi:hypothetical protein